MTEVCAVVIGTVIDHDNLDATLLALEILYSLLQKGARVVVHENYRNLIHAFLFVTLRQLEARPCLYLLPLRRSAYSSLA